MSLLQGVTPKTTFGGTHRAASPADTLARLETIMGTFGITRVANVTGLDTIGIPTCLAVRPTSRSLSVSQGKGTDVASARVSAIMESVEQYFAEIADLPLRRCSYHELVGKRKRVADIARLPRCVRTLKPDTPILWVEGRDLKDGDATAVPFELVHADLRLPLPSDSGYFPIGTNGLASGNCQVEAVLHGLFELIERDSLALFYALDPEAQCRRRLDLDTVNDAAARALLERYRAARVRVAVWDMTSNLGVAAFFCSIIEETVDPFRPVGRALGFGCHAHSGVALCRALCEAAQSRLTRITGSRDDISHEDFSVAPSLEKVLEQQSELDRQGRPVRRFVDVPTADRATFEADLAACLERLEANGVGPVTFVALSPPELPFSVVRVVVAGLEGVPAIPGYVPGVRARTVNAEA